MPAVSCKAIIQKHFDDRLSSGFSEWLQLIDAENEIGLHVFITFSIARHMLKCFK